MLFRLRTRQRTCKKKFLTIEFCEEVANLWAKTFFLRSPAFRKNFEQKPFILFFGEHFRIVSLVLGLEHSHPSPQIFLVSLALSLVSLTPPVHL